MPPDKGKTRKVKKSGDVQSGGGYPGVGKTYDSYGNVIDKNSTVEYFRPGGDTKAGLMRHVMGAKRGPKKHRARGVTP